MARALEEDKIDRAFEIAGHLANALLENRFEIEKRYIPDGLQFLIAISASGFIGLNDNSGNYFTEESRYILNGSQGESANHRITYPEIEWYSTDPRIVEETFPTVVASVKLPKPYRYAESFEKHERASFMRGYALHLLAMQIAEHSFTQAGHNLIKAFPDNRHEKDILREKRLKNLKRKLDGLKALIRDFFPKWEPRDYREY